MFQLRISPFCNPYLNLALENSFLENLEQDQQILFLYINEPSIVLGRFQNPWIECNPSKLKTTHLVRRQSGGGTVYHDRGNLNFSFIGEEEGFDKTDNLTLICLTMASLGVSLEINDRHDLIVKDRGETFKVSGSAFRHKRGRVFHHGTLLIQTDKEKLHQALLPDENRNIIKAGGTASFRSKVKNLREVYEKLCPSAVLKQFRQSFNEPPFLDWETWRTSEQVQDEIKLLTSEMWLLDKTPFFKQDISGVFPLQENQMIIGIKKGIISDTPEDLPFLKGIPYGRKKTALMLKSRINDLSGPAGTKEELYRRLLHIIR